MYCCVLAFYLAIESTLQQMRRQKKSNDWIIALTDGEDNCSRTCTVNSITNQLRNADVGLVVIGIGSDVQTEVVN